MTTSSTDSSQTSESPESPQKPSVSTTNLRKRAVSKNKQEEEETVIANRDNSSPSPQQEDVESAFLGIQETVKNMRKLFPILAMGLLTLFLINLLVRPIGTGKPRSDSQEKSIFPAEFGEHVTEFESVMQKLRDQVEAFDEARKLMQEKLESLEEKLDSLDEKLARMDSENSVTQTALENLKLELSEFNQSLSELHKVPDNIAGNLNESTLAQKFAKISDFTRILVEEEIERHEADGIGKVDYALASGGATILRHSEPEFPVNEHKHLVHPDAIKMLQPSFGEPGHCFSFKGDSGYAEIRLRTEIFPESVTLEHVSHRVAYNLSSAPKDCNVTGWLERNGSASVNAQNETIEVHNLVSFRYDLKKKNLQTFEVKKKLNYSEELVVSVVRFEFASNYGGNHTCIYRFRVHGHEANGAFGRVRRCRNSATGKLLVNRSVLLLAMFVFLAI
ncbi:SUN domain-containing protein 2-like [Punica granatum]|uniref:SUN domain-containing protein 2-like n=2 Tax=Punica granatum TaxID=22663 RepID=A0A6P8E6U9_PUNGR|nr:SUN domain-containing protein 2-like [Punica granatum]PKI52202.1 hypothetical protein CRG98_027377 [Punica granatum]